MGKCDAMCLGDSEKCSKCSASRPETKPPPEPSSSQPGNLSSSGDESGDRRLASLDGVPPATASTQATALVTGAAPLPLSPLLILPFAVVIYLLIRCIQGILAKRRRDRIRAVLKEMELDRLVEIVIWDPGTGCTKVGR